MQRRQRGWRSFVCRWPGAPGPQPDATAPLPPPRAGHRPDGPGSPAQHGPGYDPGTMGTVPGVVAHSDVDAVPDDPGQGGGPVMGHDSGHRGVDPPGRVAAFLGEAGAAGILPQDRVPDVTGQPAIAGVGELAIDDGLIEPGRGRRHPPWTLRVLQDRQALAVEE